MVSLWATCDPVVALAQRGPTAIEVVVDVPSKPFSVASARCVPLPGSARYRLRCPPPAPASAHLVCVPCPPCRSNAEKLAGVLQAVRAAQADDQGNPVEVKVDWLCSMFTPAVHSVTLVAVLARVLQQRVACERGTGRWPTGVTYTIAPGFEGDGIVAAALCAGGVACTSDGDALVALFAVATARRQGLLPAVPHEAAVVLRHDRGFYSGLRVGESGVSPPSGLPALR
jgi:hypothetical protein